MAKKNMSMLMEMSAMPPYEGKVSESYLAAAKQSSSFLNDLRYAAAEPMRGMLKADLIATGKYAIENTIGGRTIAARIRDEASRIFGEDEVTTWY